MDDMKQLIEKYKRELIEYSKAAPTPPKERLEFPEMTYTEKDSEPTPEEIAAAELFPDNEATETDIPQPIEEQSSQPQIIGYSDNGDFSDSFNELMAQIQANTPQSDDSVEGVSTVTPEEAERLDDVPQSGGDEDEQLARRDFSEEQPLVNSRDDIEPLQQSGEAAEIPQEQRYSSLEEYNSVNNRSGTLRFRVYTARGALPVEGVNIEISKPIGGGNHVFYSLTTDNSGLTRIVSLPAPPKELSETPDSDVQPFAMYNVDVAAAGFNSVAIRDLPVFEGVLSLQNISLVPDVGQDTEVIVEQEPALNGGV